MPRHLSCDGAPEYPVDRQQVSGHGARRHQRGEMEFKRPKRRTPNCYRGETGVPLPVVNNFKYRNRERRGKPDA
eukprot:10871336-Heterocapsa_arctica.AAC.1